jgi:hypothetical protein
VRKHGFDFGTEQEPLGRQLVVQRLDAQTVAGDEQRFRISVPDGKGEHAAQVLYAVGAILFEKVDDGFGIAVGAVAMAAGDELLRARQDGCRSRR